MTDAEISSLRSGVLYSAQEKRPSNVLARLPSRNDDSELVDGGKVFTSRTM